MFIRLVNFRCYKDSTFEFDDNGLYLISATSGTGKTSILMGIYFALYGKGDDVVSHSEKGCSVELHLHGVKIVRTKRPNKLIVQDIYENDVGQQVINKKFGNTFDITSFVRGAELLNTFVMLRPIEKMEFLERFAFKGCDPNNIKEKIRASVSEKKEELTKLETENTVLQGILAETQIPKEVKFPFKTNTKEIRERILRNEKIKIKNSIKNVKKYTGLIKSMEMELTDTTVLREILDTKSQDITKLENKLDSLNDELESVDYVEGSIAELKKQLTLAENSSKRISDEEKLADMLETLCTIETTETSKLKERIEKLESTNWVDYTQEELRDFINKLKKKKTLNDHLNILKDQVSSITIEDLDKKKLRLTELDSLIDTYTSQLLQIREQRIVYKCPGCSINLSLDNGCLCITTKESINTNIDDTEEELDTKLTDCKRRKKNVEKKIFELESALKTNIDIQAKIELIKEELGNLNIEDHDLSELEEKLINELGKEKEINKLKNKLETKEYSVGYNVQKKEAERLKESIDNMEVAPEGLVENEIRTRLETAKLARQMYKNLNSQINSVTEDIQNTKLKISTIKDSHIEKYSNIKTPKEIKNIIATYTNEITSLKSAEKKSEDLIRTTEEYEVYLEQKQKYDSIIEKKTKCQAKLDVTKKQYAALGNLKQKVIEAESIAIQNILESINNHVQIYLDSFFPEQPICVKLVNFKETKTVSKPQVTIELDYKGHEVNSLSSLSDGELTRVILAFTLAMCEMFNSPVLLLDECTSYLDQELTTTVFSSIKENFKNKLVIVAAHQVVEGIFDKIVRL